MILQSYSYYSDVRVFRFTMDTDIVADFPLWKEEDDFPPLSPRKAIAASEKTLSDMLCEHPVAAPEFQSIALVREKGEERDWWYYKVTWMVWPEDPLEDRSTIELPVLLSGRCPEFESCRYGEHMEKFFS